MAQGRLPMRKVKKILEFHFDEGRSARAIASHCGLARRSVAQTLERFAASGLSCPRAHRQGRRCPPARQPDRRLPPEPARRQPYPQQHQGPRHHL